MVCVLYLYYGLKNYYVTGFLGNCRRFQKCRNFRRYRKNRKCRKYRRYQKNRNFRKILSQIPRSWICMLRVHQSFFNFQGQPLRQQQEWRVLHNDRFFITIIIKIICKFLLIQHYIDITFSALSWCQYPFLILESKKNEGIVIISFRGLIGDKHNKKVPEIIMSL